MHARHDGMKDGKWRERYRGNEYSTQNIQCHFISSFSLHIFSSTENERFSIKFMAFIVSALHLLLLILFSSSRVKFAEKHTYTHSDNKIECFTINK